MSLCLILGLLGCPPKAPPVPRTVIPDNAVLTEDGMLITDVRVGEGAMAEPGQAVTVHYSLTLGDGTVVDSSYARNAPFSFDLGAGEVIRGWDLGVAGMRVGGHRRLMVPPELGYGVKGAGPIPPYSTLLFDIELLAVE